MKQTGIRLLLAFLLIILLAVFFFTFYTYNLNTALKKSNYLVAHTNQVLYESEKLMSTLKDVETGTRGFVITGDSVFLRPYLISRDSVSANVHMLESLSADNTQQHKRIHALEALAARRLAICRDIQDMRRSPGYTLNNVKPLLITGRIIMDSLRTSIKDIQQAENDLLLVRQSETGHRQENIENSFIFLFASILTLFITAYLASRYIIKLRKKDSDALRKIDGNFVFFSKRIDDVVKGISDPFFALDKNFAFIFHNKKVEETIARGKKGLVGKNVFDIFPGYDSNIVGEKMRQVMATEESVHFEAYEDFLELWQDISIYPTAEGISVYLKDATKRKAYEKELHDTKELLEATNIVASIGGWQVDLHSGKVTWTNITRLIHETANDFVPTLTNALQFYKAGTSRAQITSFVNDAIVYGQPWDAELQIITTAGNERWVRTIGRAEFEANECLRLFGTFQDITAQKISAEKLSGERKLFRTIIDNLPVNVYTKDLQSRKTLVNKSELDFAGVASENDILGKTDHELYPDASASVSLAEDQFVFTTGTPIIDKETSMIKEDGEKVWFLTSKIPLKDNEEKVTGLVGISYNITHRKKALQP